MRAVPPPSTQVRYTEAKLDAALEEYANTASSPTAFPDHIKGTRLKKLPLSILVRNLEYYLLPCLRREKELAKWKMFSHEKERRSEKALRSFNCGAQTPFITKDMLLNFKSSALSLVHVDRAKTRPRLCFRRGTK